tara:strand:+ start:931 stop:2157 length:1227 start_codon:yes stop_codon:yes gene_type:complete
MAEEFNINNLLASILGTNMGSEGGGPGNWLQPHIPNPKYDPQNPDAHPPTIANPEFGNLPGDTPTDFGTDAGLPAWAGWHSNPYGLDTDMAHSDYVKGHALSAGAQVASSKNQAQAQMIRALIEPYISEQMRTKRELATAEKGGEISKALEKTKGEQARETQAAAAASEMDKLLGKLVTTTNDDGTKTTSREGGTMQFDRETAEKLEALKGANTLSQIAKQAQEGRSTMDHHRNLLAQQTANTARALDARFGGGMSGLPFGDVMSGLMGLGGSGGGTGGLGGVGMGSSSAGQGMGQTAALNTLAGVNPYTAAAGNVANIAGAGATGPNALSALGAGFQGQSMANLNAANLYGGDVKTAAGAIGSQLGQQYNNIAQVMRPATTAFGTGMGNVSQAYGTNLANNMNIGMA